MGDGHLYAVLIPACDNRRLVVRAENLGDLVAQSPDDFQRRGDEELSDEDEDDIEIPEDWFSQALNELAAPDDEEGAEESLEDEGGYEGGGMTHLFGGDSPLYAPRIYMDHAQEKVS